jgi:uncharacterized protein YceK
MKTLAMILACFAVGACGTMPYSQYDQGHKTSRYDGQSGDDRTQVCHKGKKTLDLPRSAVQAHINHGDRYGRC